MPVEPGEEEQCGGQAHHFRNGERPPDIVHIAGQAQQVSGRQQGNELPEQGGDGGVDAVAQGLERGAQNDADGGHGEVDADNPQGGLAQFHKGIGQFKDTQQHLGDRHKGQTARDHKAQSGGGGHFQRFGDPLRLPGAVVKGHNGNGGVIQAEQGHEEETLELVVDGEHAGGGLAHAFKTHEDLVHGEVHHGADGVHDNGGDTHGQNGFENIRAGYDGLQGEVDIGVVLQIEEQGQQRGGKLTGHGGDGSAGGAHGGDAQELHTENEHRVQKDVDDGAQTLGDHGVGGAAGGLKHPLEEDLKENAGGEQGADPGIGNAAFQDLCRCVLHHIIRLSTEQTEEDKQGGGYQTQENAVSGYPVSPLTVAFAQGFGQHGVDTHTDTDAKADLDVLYGECQTQGGNGGFRIAGDIDAVHHVVERLDQHGGDHGQRHVKQQFADGHDAHFVFSQR